MTLNKQWFELVVSELGNEYFLEMNDFVQLQNRLFPNKILPEAATIYNAFEWCSLEDVKVIILGQDPYPTPGHAHGLSFSCNASVKPLPKSLMNIYKELEQDLGILAPPNGDLQFWAKQGVLLLNTILTVEAGKPLSHANCGWEKLTDCVIQQISAIKENVVFILWGANAQNKIKLIDAAKHLIIQSSHPSPLSAYRGFFGSKPFSRSNDFLVKKGLKPIIWSENHPVSINGTFDFDA